MKMLASVQDPLQVEETTARILRFPDCRRQLSSLYGTRRERNAKCVGCRNQLQLLHVRSCSVIESPLSSNHTWSLQFATTVFNLTEVNMSSALVRALHGIHLVHNKHWSIFGLCTLGGDQVRLAAKARKNRQKVVVKEFTKLDGQ